MLNRYDRELALNLLLFLDSLCWTWLKREAQEEVVTLAKALETEGVTIIITGIGWHEARVYITTLVPRGGYHWVTSD